MIPPKLTPILACFDFPVDLTRWAKVEFIMVGSAPRIITQNRYCLVKASVLGVFPKIVRRGS